ncbi:MAG: mandelate racemase/muconate lactonizing enzyme family protein [Anaerolineae bacterium]
MLDLHQLLDVPVKIAAVEVFRFDGHYLVRTTSANGDAGVVCANSRLPYSVPIMQDLVLPYFEGQDARDLEDLVDGVYTYKSAYKLAGLAFWNPVAYVELSLLDLLGRLTHMPVGRLFGPIVRQEISVYLSSGRRDTTPEAEVAWLGERLAETGATAVKFKIGGRMSHNADALPGRTERLVPLARKELPTKALGGDLTIYVDANGSYDAEHAVEVGRMLADYDIAFLEEPCPWQAYWETQRVTAALALPVAGGEQDSSLPIFDWMIRDRVVDIVQPDMMYNGGLIRCMRVAERAAAAGMPVMPHSPKAGPEAATVLQFGSVVPNLGPHQEWRGAPAAPVAWATPFLEIHEGVVSVPDGPGLGIEYDPAIWDKAERLF